MSESFASTFVPSQFGDRWAERLERDRNRPLGEGSPDPAASKSLRGRRWEDFFPGERIVDPDAAQACLAGLWLIYDELDASHSISQQIHSSDGSFWHGVMHRREGDFSNAKYWFARVGPHPVYSPLGIRARELAAEQGDPSLADQVFRGDQFSAAKMVDACAAAVRARLDEGWCRRLQQAEWELLFAHCYRKALGR
ncbi:MAG: hypothetical protein KDA61_17575 [Planctomycetales bacterium]|nr:hypothetical protein [Planctomycetales bacterium]